MVMDVYSTHRSAVYAVREATNLYLLDEGRQEDIPRLSEYYVEVDNYAGDMIPVHLVNKEVSAICDFFQDAYLGLKLHLRMNLASMPFYKSINECIKPYLDSNGQMLFLLVSRLVQCFFSLVTGSISLKLVPEKSQIRFDLVLREEYVLNKHQIDGVLVIVYRLMEEFCPGAIKKIKIGHRSSLYQLDYYKSVFDVPIELSKTTSLIYALENEDNQSNALDFLIQREEDISKNLLVNPLLNLLAVQITEYGYKRRCEIAIEALIGFSQPTRDNVSSAMNLSVSTLQRRLKDEGTSFQEVLEATRKRLSQTYLAEKNISTNEIAYLLGYKSPSQFFKCFKGWFGVTPKAYRNSFMCDSDNIILPEN